MTTQITATVPGTEISLYNQATWSRATVADGKWLQNETLEPISANDRILASAINYVSGGVDDLTYRIDLLEDASDVINVYGTWTDFVTHSGELFDTSAITNNDIIKVLNDPNQYPDLTAEGGHQTYFRWSADNGSIWPLDPTEGQWEYIGYIEPYYNKNEVNTIIDDLSATVKDEYVPWSATDCPIGDKNKANSYSLAQGSANSASYDSFAQGKRNYANSQSIAVGTDNSAKSQSQALGNSNSAYSDSFAAGSNNSAATNATFAQGTTNYAHNSSFAQGTSNSALTQSFAQGKNNSANYYAFAQGLSAFADNESLAQGLEVTAKSKSLAQGATAYANNEGLAQGLEVTAEYRSFAQGQNNKATYNSVAIGNSNSADNQSFAVGTDNIGKYEGFSHGIQNESNADSLAQGQGNSADTRSLAQGLNNYAYHYSLAQGQGNNAKTFSLAQGISNSANSYAAALGTENDASETSIAQGNANTARSQSIAIGNTNSAYLGSVAIGGDNVASTYSQAFGNKTSAISYSMAIGKENYVSGDGSIAGGVSSNIIGNGTLVIGEKNTVSADASIIAGKNNIVNEKDETASYFVLGNDNVTVPLTEHYYWYSNRASIIAGYNNKLSGTNAVLLFGRNHTVSSVVDGNAGAYIRDSLVVGQQHTLKGELENVTVLGQKNNINATGTGLDYARDALIAGYDNTVNGSYKSSIILGGENHVNIKNGLNGNTLGNVILGEQNSFTLNSTTNGLLGAIIAGLGNNVSGSTVTVIGQSNEACAAYSNIFGDRNKVINAAGYVFDVAVGNSNVISGNMDYQNSFAFGSSNKIYDIKDSMTVGFDLSGEASALKLGYADKYVIIPKNGDVSGIDFVEKTNGNRLSEMMSKSAKFSAYNGTTKVGEFPISAFKLQANTAKYISATSAANTMIFNVSDALINSASSGYQAKEWVNTNGDNVIGSAQSGKTAYNILSSTKISAVGQGLSNTGFAYLSAGFRISAGDNLTIATAANNTIQLNSTPGINTYFNNVGYDDGVDPTGTTGLITGISAKYNNDSHTHSYIINQSVVFGTTDEQISGLLIQPASNSEDNYVLTYSTADNSYTWKNVAFDNTDHNIVINNESKIINLPSSGLSINSGYSARYDDNSNIYNSELNGEYLNFLYGHTILKLSYSGVQKTNQATSQTASWDIMFGNYAEVTRDTSIKSNLTNDRVNIIINTGTSSTNPYKQLNFIVTSTLPSVLSDNTYYIV